MAKRDFFADIDLNQNEMQFAVLHSLGTAPSSGTEVAGQLYYDTGSNTPFFWNGSTWTSMSSATASTVPWSGVQSGTNTNQTLTVGSNTVFIIGDGSLEFQGSGAGTMTLDTNLTGAVDRTVNLPNVSATSTILASSDSPSANQFVVATGSTEGIVEYRVIANSDIAGILALNDLTDVVLTTPANPSYLRYNGSNWIDVAASQIVTDINGSLDHGTLAGLNDDDHGQYIISDPGNNTRNVIDPTTNNVTSLTIQGAPESGATATYTYFLIEDESGNDIFSVGQNLGIQQIEIGTVSDVNFDANITIFAGHTLTFIGSGGNVTLDLPGGAIAGWSFTLPGNGGSSGQFLQTDGSGNTSWQTVSVANALDDLTDVTLTTPANPSYLRYNGSLWIDVGVATLVSDVESSIDHGNIAGLSDDDHTQYIIDDPSSRANLINPVSDDITGLTIQAATNSGSATFDIFAVTDSAAANLFSVQDQSGSYYARFASDLTGITMSAALSIVDSALVLVNGSANFVSIGVPASFTSWSLTLPSNDGSNGQFLQTNGSGVTTWADALTSVALNDLTDVVLTSPANPSYLRYNGSNWIDVASSQIVTDIESSIDHGSIAGLGDDDHTQYIIDAPGTDARNVITSSSNARRTLALHYDVAAAPTTYTPWFEILGNSGLSNTLFSVGIGPSSYQIFITDASLTVGGSASFGGTATFNNVVTHNARVDIDDNSTVRFYDDNDSNYVAFDVPSAVSSNYTLTFPDAGPPGANYVLMADASGDFSWVDGSGVAVSDHGSLSGLGDDDHTQYHTDARALTWLGTRSTSDLPEGSNLYFTDERVDDRVAALIQNGTGISWSYNDGANTLTPTVSLASFSLDDLSDVVLTTPANPSYLRYNGSNWIDVAPSQIVTDINGSLDHGTLAGLTDDDHDQYIFDTPSSGRDNTITPSDNTTALILRAPVGAANRFTIQDNGGTNELFAVNGNNDLEFAGDQIFFNHPDGAAGGYVLITRGSTGDGGYINLSSTGAGSGGYIVANTNGAQDAGFLAMNSNGSSRGGNIDLAAAIGTSSERAGQWTGTAGASGRGGDLIMDGSQEDAGDIDISGGSSGSPGGSILTYGGFASSGSPDLSGGHIHTYGANGTSGVRRGGNIETHGGAGGRGGDLLMVGPGSSGSAGDINTSGGVAGSGGSIFLQGGTAGSGGTINLTGSTTGDGGDIDLRAGTLVDGGSIDMSGGTAAGGSLTTSNGGGSIDTNAGTIELGVSGTRLTLSKSVTADRSLGFIDEAGFVPVFSVAPIANNLFALSDGTTGKIKFTTRNIGDLNNVDTSGASTNDLLQLNGSGDWVAVDPSTVGVTDHGGLTGLSDDDHTQYIIDDPGNNTRNVIASSTNDTISLTITASGNSGSATFDIFRIEDSANTELFSLSDDSGNFNAIFTADMNAVGFFCDLAITESNITLVNAASQSIVISMPTSGVSNWSLVLPVNDGASGQFLQTNGSGVTSWATALTSVSLNDLTDVVLTSPANPSYLRYNGSNWIDVASSQILTDIESSIDHGSIAGLADDDHSQYIHNAPTGTRNIIQAANSTTIPLSVRGNATQAVDVFVVESSGGTNYLTIANSGNATFSQDVTITGDLTVNGTTTTINTTELVVEDNIIVVNSLGTVQNAGLEVERGASANASVYFDETANEWYVDNASVALQLARKYVDSSTVVGNGVLTTFAVTHNMGTSDVIVALYDSSDNQVEVEVVITNSNTVTFNFNDAVPNLTAYKAVIVG